MKNIQTFNASTITERNKSDFDAISYSEFKYGITTHGIRFANKLFKVFDKKLFDSNLDYIVYSSPFQSIPTATYSMALEFYKLLKKRAEPLGRSVKFEKLFRDPTYTVDYGTLTKEQRLKLIGEDTFSFIKTPNQESTLIFLDDIKVTGSHEFVLRNSIEKFKLRNHCILGYYAIVHPELPAKYEHDINEAAIGCMKDLINITQHTDFKFNTRIIKRLLISKPRDFEHVLNALNVNQLRLILDLATSNGYHQIEAYWTNIQTLQYFIVQNISD